MRSCSACSECPWRFEQLCFLVPCTGRRLERRSGSMMMKLEKALRPLDVMPEAFGPRAFQLVITEMGQRLYWYRQERLFFIEKGTPERRAISVSRRLAGPAVKDSARFWPVGHQTGCTAKTAQEKCARFPEAPCFRPPRGRWLGSVMQLAFLNSRPSVPAGGETGHRSGHEPHHIQNVQKMYA